MLRSLSDPLADTGPEGIVGVGTDERPDVVRRDLEDAGVVAVDGLEERDTRVRDVRGFGPEYERDRRGDSREIDPATVDDQFVRDQPVLQGQLLDELPEQFGRDGRPAAIQRATRPARTRASGSSSRPPAFAGRSVESVAGRPSPRTPS